MTDYTELFSKYREISRMVWNFGFKPPPEFSEHVALRLYREITARLYEAMIVLSLGYDGKLEDGSEPGELMDFHVVAKTPGSRWLVDLSPEPHYGSWEECNLPLSDASAYDFKFLDFFDWDQLGHRECRYIKVLIQRLDIKPEWENRKALLDASECFVMYGQSEKTGRPVPPI